ncbi:MAG: GAF domain-containing sensor histidine kinase [Bacteroidetes bacterium]|nr:GAF domain-containing sensor histidine kinase [Bacteroidota bacterium]MCW5896795.1 GAF domain-containing sensor histidine kinase [Bacteroidota bacterium]
MRFPSIRAVLALAVDAALLVACLIHIPYLLDRPQPPFALMDIHDRVVVKRILDASACPDVRVGDTLMTWGTYNLTNRHEVEFLSDFASIGERVQVTVGRGGQTEEKAVQLVETHDTAYMLIVLFVGIVAWGTGVFVVIRRPADRAAYLLHWSMVMMGVSVMITWGGTPPGDGWVHASRVLFFISYAGTVATFLHFTFVFPHPAESGTGRTLALYLPPALLATAMSYFHVLAVHRKSPELFATYHSVFEIFVLVAFVYVCTGIVRFVRAFLGSTSPEERKKLTWVLWGLSLGPTPFFLFTLIPQYHLGTGFLPEQYTLLFLVLIPVAFGISFYKYQLLDVQVIVNRTTVYGIVLGLVIGIYMMLVATLAFLAERYTTEMSVAAAIVVALLFEPVRRRVHHIVDKRFFRVRYNFREALSRISRDLNLCVDAKQLAEILIARMDDLIPVERTGIFLLRQPENRLYVLSHKGFGFLERRTVQFRPENIRTPLLLPIALNGCVEDGVAYETADQDVFARWGISLVIPMRSATGAFTGFMVHGSRKSGEKFSREDIDLLVNLAARAGSEFERIALQRKLIEEQEEKQRLEDVNRMKSEFVSNVSHELRTPLTSIKLYAEMLGAGRHSTLRLQQYAATIVGEADRLDRMVTNVLDTSRIERGEKHYTFAKTDLREIVGEVLQTMKFQLHKHGFTVLYNKPARRMLISADRDAAVQALMNLVENAIKYSGPRKWLRISLTRERGYAVCSVRDKGIGVPPEHIPKLFERFYRDPSSRDSVPGIGLGLGLVRSIMDAHRGKIEVTGSPGGGSTFALRFPAIVTRTHKRSAK